MSFYLTATPRDLGEALRRYVANTKQGEKARESLAVRLAAYAACKRRGLLRAA